MAQIFHRSTNFISRFSVFSSLFLVGLGLTVILGAARSPYLTNQNQTRQQPVQFSHKHHVGDDGIDCRYCHTSVETSSFAGIPATEICMSCHSQIWSNAEILEPVRASYRTGESLQWTRVHDLPDFVYFNHSMHIYKGIGCATCHGRVDQMPLMMKENTLYMNWCINCHRNPERYVRPRDQVFNMTYEPPANQEELGRKLVEEYQIQSLTDCYTCHR